MICNNCKAEIADGAKLCPLCHVVPVVMFGKPKNTGPSPAAPSASKGIVGWIVLLVVIAVAAYSYLHPELTAALTGSGTKLLSAKGPNGPDSIRAAHAATDRQNAQADQVAGQLKDMGVITDQTAAAPAEAKPAESGQALQGLWAKVFGARDKANAHQNAKIAEMNNVDDQLGPAGPPPAQGEQAQGQPQPAQSVDALDLLKDPAPAAKR